MRNTKMEVPTVLCLLFASQIHVRVLGTQSPATKLVTRQFVTQNVSRRHSALLSLMLSYPYRSLVVTRLCRVASLSRRYGRNPKGQAEHKILRMMTRSTVPETMQRRLEHTRSELLTILNEGQLSANRKSTMA